MTVQESVGGEGVRDMPVMEDILAQPPSVYAVGRAYRIMVPVRVETLCWCEVGGESYEDESCGILRSSSLTHAVTVPMEALDRAGGYTLCFRVVRQRKPYFSEVSETVRLEVPFRPLPEGRIRLFMVADAHNRIAAPVAAAGRPDLLVLNGDVPEDSGRLENFTTIHAIAGQVTRGEVPTVFARGNHDLRGVCAERLAEHTPTQDGRSYYTFRLGTLWGIVLDCGEDKSDDHAEYGHTVCCHAFRRRETAFLRDVVAHADEEYAAVGVTRRLVVCHVPFSQVLEPPFDIEQDLYREWCRLLREQVRPHLMLCGHIHDLYVTQPGEGRDHLGQPCPVVVGSRPGPGPERFVGTEVTLETDGRAVVEFLDQDRVSLGRVTLELK